MLKFDKVCRAQCIYNMDRFKHFYYVTYESEDFIVDFMK